MVHVDYTVCPRNAIKVLPEVGAEDFLDSGPSSGFRATPDWNRLYLVGISQPQALARAPSAPER